MHIEVIHMRMVKGFALIWLACCLMLGPVFALAEAVGVSEEAKSACVAAGGVLFEQMHTTHVLSPYGTQSVVLRSAPSDSYDAVAMLMVGQAVTAAGEYETFCFIMTEDGVFGWLAADEIEAAEPF